MGERTPHLDATVRAAWVGLTAKHTRGHLVRSVIEGVCFSQKDGLDIIEGMGVPVKSVRVSGGGAKSAFWRQLLADILNKRVVTLNTSEGSAYGAALLACAGTGAFASVEEACAASIREVDSVEPRPDRGSRLRERSRRLSIPLSGPEAGLRFDRYSCRRRDSLTLPCRSRSTRHSPTGCRRRCVIASSRDAASWCPSARAS